MSKVKIWQELVSIPTYETAEPEKNPIFLEKRVYQGSSGAVYPYPVIEKISDVKADKEWLAVFLENEFIKIMVLPALGGRIQMAYDKSLQRHFIYYNSVIKPALVGLTGPWISGGIEFNWPQHHRPSTYEPLDYVLQENPDGSATVWCSELERMSRTKGMAGFTLHPGKAYIEIKVKIHNRTNLPQTFLWWANPAVKVNDHYQSVFPPDVHAVFDHGKRDVSSFPIARGTYYKVDYSPGTDISRYKNIPVPTSYMAVNSRYDFVGGYENDSRGGLLHLANHHVSPGKKQWTWGKGDFGQAWDRNLTDEDGPYIELMCGVYTDNQPDFTWLAPNEEKSFVQYFMPYRDLGLVKNAGKEALLNLELQGKTLEIKLYTTGIYPKAQVELSAGGKRLFSDRYDASPRLSYQKSLDLPEGIKYEELCLSLTDQEGRTLVAWQPEKLKEDSMPEPAQAAKAPEEIRSLEQLYLTGLHLEQYRHATFDPVDYYNEALRREPGDTRCNNALGLWLLRRAKFADAQEHFEKAIATWTERNPNPYDGEAFYNLGLSLQIQDQPEEAYAAFYKATWNAAWQNAAYLHLAQIDAARGRFSTALEHVDKSLGCNSNDHRALHLKIALLRRVGSAKPALQPDDQVLQQAGKVPQQAGKAPQQSGQARQQIEQARQLAEQALALDAFNFGALYEQFLLSGDQNDLETFAARIRNNIHNYMEYALDYAAAGLWTEASALLSLGLERSGEYPLARYLLGWCSYKQGDKKAALAAFNRAGQASPAYCFPNQTEAVPALKLAIEMHPAGAKAYYYLGNFWYNARQYADAAECWEKSAELDEAFPTVFRNLALYYFNKAKQADKALACMEKAHALEPRDARVLMELDQLYKRLNRSPEQRLDFLEQQPALVEQRDDLYLERLSLYNLLGEHAKALELLLSRKFHPWEGGEGKVSEQYVLSLLELAKKALRKKEFEAALVFLQKSLSYPLNLAEGKLLVAQENDIYYWMACALEGLNRADEAARCWEHAGKGITEPAAAFFYNDQKPDKILYQGWSLLKLGRREEANERFNTLIDYGDAHINDQVKIDYFAVSLPDLLIWEEDLNRRNQIHCRYIKALGLMGLGRMEEARDLLNRVLESDQSHSGARFHLNDVLHETPGHPADPADQCG